MQMEPRKCLPALQTQPRTWNSGCFFSSLCISRALLILPQFFLHFSPFTSFAFHFVQKPQQDTILLPPTRAWLTNRKVIKLLKCFFGGGWLFLWAPPPRLFCFVVVVWFWFGFLCLFFKGEGEVGRNNCECQERAGYWGGAVSSQPLSRFNHIFRTLTQMAKSLRAAGLDQPVTLNTSHRLNGGKKSQVF